MLMTEKFYTVQEVATILRKSEDTVKKWLRSGQLEGSRPGGREWLVTEEALRKIVEQNKNTK